MSENSSVSGFQETVLFFLAEKISKVYLSAVLADNPWRVLTAKAMQLDPANIQLHSKSAFMYFMSRFPVLLSVVSVATIQGLYRPK